jgi:hypothetical protein
LVDAKSKRRRASARSRTLGVAASVGAHVLFLALLVLGARVPNASNPSRAVEVQLVSPTPPKTRPRRAQARAAFSMEQLQSPPATPGAEAAPGPPAPPWTTPPVAPGLALRRALGCDHADYMELTPEERQGCRDRFAAGDKSLEEVAEFGVDPRKRAIFEAGAKRDRFLQEPFLAEKPKKGCRPMVTVQSLPANGPVPTGVTAGVACGVQF